MPTEWIWINGKMLPLSEARIGVEDRGFQFADGVYEVMRLYQGVAFTMTEHLDRLSRSAAGIELSVPLSSAELGGEIRRLVARSGIAQGMVYLQLTRGASPRNHLFPADAAPTLLFYARPLPPIPAPGLGEGVKLLSLADERWKRCWIKSIALLPNVLAKNQAISGGFDEAVFVDDGFVNECSSSNLFIVSAGKLITHPVSPKVLPGITRAVLLQCAAALGIDVLERPIRESEAIEAAEVFITSTTREVSWAAQWNDQPIGSARCGPVTLALHRALQERIGKETGAWRSPQPLAQTA